MPNDISLAKLLDSLGEAFKEDPSRASLTLSSLGNGEYYASAVRYAEAYGEKKSVVAGVKASSLKTAVAMLITKLELVGVRV